MDGRPEEVDQFLFADKMFGIAQEAEERVESLGLERYCSAGPFQQPVARIKLKIAEAVSSLR